MDNVKLWRVAVLVAIPFVLIGLQEQAFPIGSFRNGGHSLRDDVRSAIQRMETRHYNSARMDSVAARTELSEGRVRMAFGGREMPQHALLWQQIHAELAGLPARDSNTTVTVVVDYTAERRYQFDFAGWGASWGNWENCVNRPNRPGAQSPADSRGVLLPPLLGQCALPAAFGEPGPAVRAWVEGIRLPPGIPAFARSRVFEMDSSGRRRYDASTVGEYWWTVWRADDFRTLGCRDGELAECRVVLEKPSFGGTRGAFIWWLARRDPQKFHAFWHAEGSYEEAARASFGEPLTALLSRYLQDYVIVVRSGPRQPDQAPLAAALVLTLAFMVALLLAKRRVLA